MVPVRFSLFGGRIGVSFPFDPVLVEQMHATDPRARWHREEKVWAFPLEQYVFLKLCDVFGVDPPDTARRLAQGLLADPARTMEDMLDLCEMLVGKLPPRPVPNVSLIGDFEPRFPPYEHQRLGLAELIEHPWWGLWWDMGIGKTKAIVDRIAWAVHKGERPRVLVLCPKPVIPTWVEQLVKYAGYPCVPITGTAQQKRAAIKRLEGWVAGDKYVPIGVVNYDTLLSVELSDSLERIGFDMLVGDEIQLVKNSTSKRSARARRLSVDAKYRFALSGTPAPNNPLDWFGILLWLDPTGRLAGTNSKTAFGCRYAIFKKDEGSNQRFVAAYRDLADLRQRVASCGSRQRKEECLDLPPKTYVVRRCELAGEQLRVYRQLQRDAVTRIQKANEATELTARNVLTEVLRLLQVVGGAVPDDAGTMHWLSPNAKLALFEEVLEEVGPRQVVVWSAFRQELEFLRGAMEKVGRRVALFHGGVDQHGRSEALTRFRSGDADTFLATMQTGGTGVDGLQVADTEIFYSRNHNWGQYAQAVDRLHRGGQERPVTVISLVADGTIDNKVAAALERKEGLMESILGSGLGDVADEVVGPVSMGQQAFAAAVDLFGGGQ